MRRLIVFLALVLSLGAAILKVQQPYAQTIMYMPGTGGVTTVVTNTVYGAYSFVAPTSPFSGTMVWKDVTFYVSAVSGTPGITFYLYSDNGGVPNHASGLLDTSEEKTPTATAHNTWANTSGSKTTLVPGTMYWLVAKRTSSTTSATLSFIGTMGGGTSGPPNGPATAGAASSWNEDYVRSDDSGSTWTAATGVQLAGFRIGFTDGTDSAYFGMPHYSQGQDTTNKVYWSGATSYVNGVRFTLPANARLKVKSAMMLVRCSGTGDSLGAMQYQLYSGGGANPTLVATTRSIPAANVKTTASNLYRLSFADPVTMTGGTTYDLVLAAASGGSATNYHSTYKYTIHNDADSKALLPFGGLSQVYGAVGSFSTVTTSTVGFALFLDTGGEYVAGGAGGGGAWVR